MNAPDTTDNAAFVDGVVAGVDGSPNARAALAWAADEATWRQCSLHVLHAWTLPTPRTGGRAAPPTYVPETGTYRAQAQALVEQEMGSVLGESGSVSCSALRGKPLSVLLEAGRNARMLVVGSSSTRLRVNSLSGQLVHQAPCPVLVVPGSG